MTTQSKRRETGRKRPHQARSKATVEAILQAASQVLVADGYAHMSTTRVAERAGVSIGTLYQYFGDKQQLVRALKQELIERMQRAMVSALAEARGADLELQVRVLLRTILQTKQAERGLGPALLPVLLELDGQLPSAEMAAPARELVTGMLAPHAARLGLQDVAQAAETLVHAVDGVVLSLSFAASPERPLADERNVDELVRLVLGYLAAEPIGTGED